MKPATDDPGSLSHLHDIVAAPPVPWLPPAPAWFVLAALVAIMFGLLVAWFTLRWRRNWYRRAGLLELQHIEQSHSQNSTALFQLAELLKRVALVAYPGQPVASLAGTAWLQFLDQTSGSTAFSMGTGQLLTQIYDRDSSPPTPELYQLIRSWIRTHRSDIAC